MRKCNKKRKISITKYNPENIQSNGLYNEWTSISDIGKVYNGITFTYKDYLEVETKYVLAVFEILRFFGSEGLKIKHLFKIDVYNDFEKYNSLDWYDTYSMLFKEMVTKDKELISQLIRLRLREHIAELELQVGNKPIQILFGFDYYMYLNTNLDVEPLLHKISDLGLYCL